MRGHQASRLCRIGAQVGVHGCIVPAHGLVEMSYGKEEPAIPQERRHGEHVRPRPDHRRAGCAVTLAAGTRPAPPERTDDAARNLAGASDPKACSHVKADLAVGADVLPEQRGQAAAVGRAEHGGPCLLGEDVLEHERVHVHQGRLEDPQAQCGHLDFLVPA